jgi:hypothetical protein
MSRRVGTKRRLRELSLRGLVVVAVIGAATFGSVASPAQAANRIAMSHDDSVSGVSCVGPSSCVAVGMYQRDNVQYALAEHWNGRHWSLMTIPQAAQSYLSGVSCTGPTTCWAVSNPNNGIAQLQGTKWEGVPSAGDSLALMYGISCTRPPETCSAVGTQYAPMSGGYGAIVEQWMKPGTWEVLGIASPSSPSPDNFVAGVSCSSRTNCIAVGSAQYVVSFNPPNVVFGWEPLASIWDGTGWTAITVPSDGMDSGLSAVSCDAPTDCMAVGYDGGAGLAEHWNGSAWSIVSNQLGAGMAVSCVSPTFCMAVGPSALENWNGSSWSTYNTSAASGDFDGVSCTSTSNCMAVGGSGDTQTAHWNGRKWYSVQSPNR